MAKGDFCALCGEWFVKEGKNYNQKYCSSQCVRKAKNEAANIWKRRQSMREKVSVTQPKMTIQAVMEIADNLSTQYGRVVSYGEVQSMLYAGKIDKRGCVVK